jgi:hypothetical protein
MRTRVRPTTQNHLFLPAVAGLLLTSPAEAAPNRPTGNRSAAAAPVSSTDASMRDASTASSSAPAATAPAPPAATDPDTPIRVVYVPEMIKAQLREDIKKEVLSQAEREGWAAPHQVPSWLHRLQISLDLLCRYEAVAFADGNASGGEFPDFNAINAGEPLNVNFVDLANERYLNVDRDRIRLRYQANVALDADLAQGFFSRVRLASGNDNSPVSTNQSLGVYFGKYRFWLDQAFVRYAPARGQDRGWQVDVGRIANPFRKTNLTWDDDVTLDGIATRGHFTLLSGIIPFMAGGGFLLQGTPLHYPAERTAKLSRRDKWLYAAQLGLEFHLGDSVELTLAGAYLHFDRVRGKVSHPCDTHLQHVTCNTDTSRPGFAQKGNTYMALRTPSDAALMAESTTLAPRYQYFGLATAFHEAIGFAQLSVSLPADLSLRLVGEYVRNLAFKKKRIAAVALNNRAPVSLEAAGGEFGAFAGGNEGYLGRVVFSRARDGKRWDWQAAVGYRYIESDAALDAFTNSDIGLGGTNLEGYVVEAKLALADRIWLGGRLLSSDNIVGPPYSVDILHIDLAGRL